MSNEALKSSCPSLPFSSALTLVYALIQGDTNARLCMEGHRPFQPMHRLFHILQPSMRSGQAKLQETSMCGEMRYCFPGSQTTVGIVVF